jgi:ribosomal protein S18 acetylase RimI-like enzyme
MRIRPAQFADIAVLAEFARWTYARAFGDSMAADDLAHHLEHRLSAAYFAEALRNDAILLVLEDALTGFVQLGPANVEDDRPGDMQLRRLYVHPERKGKGIGSQLLRAALAHPAMQYAPRIFLDVWDRNEGARRLYERFGFRVVGTVPFVTPSGEVTGQDLLMMLIPSEAAPHPPR